MNVGKLAASFNQPVADPLFRENSQKNDTFPDVDSGTSGVRTRAVSEYYKATSMSLEFTSKDGDKVSLSMNSLEYSKSILDVAANGSKEDMKKLIDFIKDTFASIKKGMFDQFLKKGNSNEEVQTSVTEPQNIGVSEEWDAEHTSQRIVDFAVSFFGSFKGASEDFLATIKNAIEDGFKQARDIMDELPDQVNSLIDDTHSKVMEKLSSWADAQKIQVPVSVDPVV